MRKTQSVEHIANAAEGFDQGKHPRLGGPPNAGWFAATGGGEGTGTGQRREKDTFAQVPQPGQPPARGAPPGNPSIKKKARNPFGTWPERPAGTPSDFVQDKRVPPLDRLKLYWTVHDLNQREVGKVLKDNNVVILFDPDDKAGRAELAQRGRPPLPQDAVSYYDSPAGIIHVFNQTTLPDGTLRRVNHLDDHLRHEVGHAVDHYLGDISKSPGFLKAYYADVAASMDPGLVKVKGDDHALSHPQEAFAEAYARDLGGMKGEGALHNTINYMRQSPQIQQLKKKIPKATKGARTRIPAP